MRVQLRWRDMDMLGHLNQSVYHELLEEGRAGLISEILRRTADDVHGGYVVVHVDLDYRHEVRRDHGEVEVVVTLKRVGTLEPRARARDPAPGRDRRRIGHDGARRLGPGRARQADDRRGRAGRADLSR